MPTTTLSITNPATGALVLRVAADGPREVAARYAAARAAQPRWAATPMRRRIAAIEKFRELIIARTDALANTLTQEVGKPIRQSRNELKGLIGRLDFFIAESARALREQKVFVDAAQKLDERITHEPLGVVANISAWNYPYFVGSNVFVAALVAGNTVLYKPSEFATLTGRHIADLLHVGVQRLCAGHCKEHRAENDERRGAVSSDEVQSVCRIQGSKDDRCRGDVPNTNDSEGGEPEQAHGAKQQADDACPKALDGE